MKSKSRRRSHLSTGDNEIPVPENPSEHALVTPKLQCEGGSSAVPEKSGDYRTRDVSTSVDMTNAIVCPVCGAVAVQEKCKVICRSEVCRGRVILNCSEF